MRWLELTVQTHPEAVESVSELLSRYTSGGVAIEEPIELVGAEGQEYRVLTGHRYRFMRTCPLMAKRRRRASASPKACGILPAWDGTLWATCRHEWSTKKIGPTPGKTIST